MAQNHITYFEKYLIPEIMSQFDKEQLISYKVESSGALDGFMSSMYSIQLKTKTNTDDNQRFLMVKLMRGDEAFKESSKSDIQFANEIYVYNRVLPAYDKLLKELKVTTINPMILVPPVYMAQFGYIEGLSYSPKEKAALLVMENLKPLGYQLSETFNLNEHQLLTMCIKLGQYHALSYALKVLNNSEFEKLKSGIIPLHFVNINDLNDVNENLYRVLHRSGFDRLFDFYDRKIDTNIFDKRSEKDLKLMECLLKIREKYFALPSCLPERLRTKISNNAEDRSFATICHGDYYRNNVLFKHEKQNGKTVVEDMKMIDFQQLRYGSPALDLSFFMYLNTIEDQRNAIWLELLKTYHSSMFHTLSTVLQASTKSETEISDILSQYSFNKFESHFSRFAFYGVMICLHFLPWLMCSKDECSRISYLFETNAKRKEFHKLLVEVGGDEVNLSILAVLRHACEMGYMDDL